VTGCDAAVPVIPNNEVTKACTKHYSITLPDKIHIKNVPKAIVSPPTGEKR
jgi:hypothetical protein